MFGGEWQKIEDRMLISASSTYPVKSTGGEATHTLTIDEMPRHEGHIYSNPGNVGDKGRYLPIGLLSAGSGRDGWINVYEDKAYPVSHSFGNSTAHNNMPPYYAVYTWLRTA